MDSQFFILCALLVFIFWSLFVSPYLVVSTRQKLFAIRDQAFLDFEHDDEEYRKLRDHINAFIRYADKVSWQRILLNVLFLSKELKAAQSTSIEFNNPEIRMAFFLSTMLLGRLFVLRSPLIIALSMPLFLFAVVAVVAVVKVELLPKIKKALPGFIVRDASIYASQ